MESVLRKREFDLFLFFAIAAAIIQTSTALNPDEYYVANATLILVESPSTIFFDIGSELPMPTISYKPSENSEDTDDLNAYGYIRNSSNTNSINVLQTIPSYSDSFQYVMSRPNSEFDTDLLYVSLQYLLPNTFVHDDYPAFPEGGSYLISKGFTNLLTVDEAVPCKQPWYFHVYLTKTNEGNDYDVLLRAIYQMDMNPVDYCSSKD